MQVMKRLTCTECGKHRDVWEFFRDFSLDFPGAGPCSVGDMVRAYFEREQITATCEACGATSASMSKHLEASPQACSRRKAHQPPSIRTSRKWKVPLRRSGLWTHAHTHTHTRVPFPQTSGPGLKSATHVAD